MEAFCKSWKLFLTIAAALLFSAGTGCGTKDFKPSKIFSLDNAWPFDDDDEDEPEEGIPVRIVGAWTDTVKSTPGQPAQRGFGGRLMFYDAEGEKPILVDGQLVVYAFDEAGRAPTDNKPTRRYVFPPDQMKHHMSKNDMGASYSFWLPWDEAGGTKTEVSLICRFEPKGGAVITGEQTRHILPGSIPTTTPGATVSAPRVPEGVPMRPAHVTLEQYHEKQRLQNGVQTTAYEAPIDPNATTAASAPAGTTDSDKQMSVTSIALPNDFQVPAGVTPQPISTTAVQGGRARALQQPAAGAQYQPFPYQQPAAITQPIMQPVQSPVMNGAAVMQSMPAVPGQTPLPNAVVQRPMVAPVNAPGVTAPQSQSFSPPLGMPQYVPQQAMMMTTPAAQPIMQPQQAGAFSQSPMPAAGVQPYVMQPAQQPAPPQGYQQSPSANGVRTAVGYGPATIPWR